MITRAQYVIAVPDLKTSSAFYCDVLGFTINSFPDPGWLSYKLGECLIMAGQCPDAIHPSKLGDHSYFAYMEMAEVDSFYKSVRTKGAKICKNLCDEPWGMREFGVQTVDGHRIMFAASISK